MKSIFNRKHELKQKLILYHAISSYQLLEVMLHRMIFHKHDKVILILPDFIIDKYPQYKNLVKKKFFDEVYLFPYLKIKHQDENIITNEVSKYYEKYIPYNINTFYKIYVAGAHFYFSLYLINQKISFTYFEDAAGMLSTPDKIYNSLYRKYPVHASIERKYSLDNGKNHYVEKIICLKKAQTINVSNKIYVNFSVEDELSKLSILKRRKVIKFFIKHRIWGRADAVLLTQNFYGFGILNEQEQKNLYEKLKNNELKGLKLAIKRHPDDKINYKHIFPNAIFINEIFPSELLPYVFWIKPDVIYTFSSTGCENLKKHFIIRKIGGRKYGI